MVEGRTFNFYLYPEYGGPALRDASFQYETRDITATADVDYVSAEGVLTIKRGETKTSSFVVSILEDGVVDPGEEFAIKIDTDAIVYHQYFVYTIEDTNQGAISIELTASPAVVSENSGATAVAVTATVVDTVRPMDTTVDVMVEGGGGSNVVGFAPVEDFQLTIPANALSGTGTFTLTPRNDTIARNDETVRITGDADLDVVSTSVRLEDDDEPSDTVNLSVGPPWVSEGNGATEVTVTATLNHAGRDVETRIAVAVSGSGESGVVDFTPVSDFEIVIAAGDTEADAVFELVPEDDHTHERDETVTVDGESDLNATVASLTLADNDEESSRIVLSADPARVSEGAGDVAVKVTAELDASARTVATTVTVSVSGSGDAGAVDFDAVNDFEIVIPAGMVESDGTLTLVPEDDQVDEKDETLAVAGTSDLPVTGTSVVLADDDETSRSVALSVTPNRVSEGDGEAAVTVTAALDAGARAVATTVTVSVSGSGDADAVDFDAVNDFEIAIPAGMGESHVTLTLVLEDDNVDETDETLAVAGTSDLPVTGTSVVLADDDETSRSVALSVTPDRVSEGDGEAAVTVTAALDAGARAVATTVTVSVSGSGDADAVDFDAVNDFEIVIPAGMVESHVTLTLVLEDDNVDETDETLAVAGTSDLPVTGTSVVLADDDETSRSVALSVTPNLVSEGDGEVTVTVTAALDAGVRAVATPVTVSVRGSGDADAVDFEAVDDFRIVIPANATNASGSFVLVLEDDGVSETDETLTVSGDSDLPVSAAAVTLTDDDSESTRIALSAVPGRISEGDGTVTVTVTATLGGSARTVETTVMVSVAGTAGANAVDFEEVDDFRIVIPDGELQASGAFALVVENDRIDELDETLQVEGTSDLPVTPATVVLADDDETPRRIALSVTPNRVSEGDGEAAVTVTAALDAGARAVATPVTVSVRGSGDADAVDFADVASFEIVIPAGGRSAEGTFTLVPEDDRVHETDETLAIAGTSDLPVTGTSVVLADDDESSRRIALYVEPAQVSEGDGATPITVTAALAGAARTTDTAVAVSVVRSGNAGVVDFEDVASFEIVIPAGDHRAEGTFTLVPENDRVDEADETLAIAGTSDLPVTGTSVVLADDDETSRSVALSVTPNRVSEGDGEAAVTVTAALDAGARAVATTVTVSVRGSGDADAVDFDAVNDFEIAIPAGMVESHVTLTLVLEDDNVDETDETLAVAGTSDLPVTGTSVVLADDDETSRSVALSVTPNRVSEGDGEAAVTVTAALDAGARAVATTVTVSVRGSGDADAVDFDAVNDFEIAIPAGMVESHVTLTLVLEDDNVDETDETLAVAGTSDLPVTGTSVVLADDDETSRSVALSVTPNRVSEGDGEAAVTVTAALDAGARAVATTVTVSVRGSGDADAVNFEDVDDFEIVIPAGIAKADVDFTLVIENDSVDEADETLTVSGASSLPVKSTSLALTDDDETSLGIALSVSPDRVSEEVGSRTVAVTATLDAGARTVETTVSVSVNGSGRADAVDFEAVDDFRIVIPANATNASGSFVLVLEDDGVSETDETLTVSGDSDLPVSAAAVTLTDDDSESTRIALSAVPGRISEGDGTVTVTVTAALGGSARTVETTVMVSVAGTAGANAVDFEEVDDFRIVIPDGELQASGAFALVVENDRIDELDETLQVEGTSDLPVTPATVVLADDDETPRSVALSVTPNRVSEGDGEAAVTVTAALDAGARAVATPVTVSVRGSGDADAVDFADVASFEIVIPAGGRSAEGTFTLVPEDDRVHETDETLAIAGTSDLPVTGTSVVLADDDESSRRIALYVEPAQVSEGDGATPITVTAALAGAARTTDTAVTVSVVRSGNAGVVDFEDVASFEIVIPAGDHRAEGTFTLVPENDRVDEADETLAIAGTSDLPVTGTSVVLADDDETSRSIDLSVTPNRVSEGDGEAAVTVTAALDAGARAVATTVTVSVRGSGDADAVDFDAVNDFEIAIPAGMVESHVTLTLVLEDDNVDETDETLAVAGTSDLPVTGTSVVLADDDETSRSVALSVTPNRVSEGDGEAAVTVTAALDAGARAVATTVTVSVRGSGDADAVDFDAVNDFEIAIPAGMVESHVTLALVLEDDNVDETDETLAVAGTSDLPVTGTSVVLADDDETSRSVDLSVTPNRVSEGDGEAAVTVTAALDAGARAVATTVTVSVRGSGDADAVNFEDVDDFEIVIPAGIAKADVDFTLVIENDSVDEADETLTVSGASSLPVKSTSLALTDDDETSLGIALSVSPDRVSEEVGSRTVAVTATLDAGARTVETTVSVSVNGSGRADAVDFEAVDDFRIVIPANATNASGSFVLVLEDDGVSETDETLTVSGDSDLPVSAAAVTLTDDDSESTRIALSAVPGRISEGDGTVTVTVTAALGGSARTVETTVMVSVAGTAGANAVDFEEVDDFRIVIPDGELQASGAFALVVENDRIDELDETLQVEGTSDLPVTPATVVLADDDETPRRIALSVTPNRVSEGDGEAAVTVTAALDAGARAVATPVTVSVRGSGDADAVDFADVASFEIVIPAGGRSAEGTFTLVPEDDRVHETDETLAIAGTSDLPVTGTSVVLADDDESSRRIALYVEPAQVSEGDGATPITVTAALAGAARTTDTAVTVSVVRSGNAGVVDFEDVASFEIVIPAGDHRAEGTFTLVPENDRVDEANETVEITGTSELPVTSASVTITDNDATASLINLAAAPARVSEHDGSTRVTVTAALDGGARTVATPVTVSVTGSGNADAVDFAPVSDFRIVIAGGATRGSGTFALVPEDDDDDEVDETLVVRGVADLRVVSTTVVLADDDQTSTRIILSLSARPATISEGDGPTIVTVTGSLDGAPRDTDTVVAVSVSGGGEDAAVDFTPVGDFEVRIRAGALSGESSFVLVPEDDRLDEMDETVTVSGLAELAVVPALLTLVDNDRTPMISVNDATVIESADEVAFTVSLDPATDARVTVEYATADTAGQPDAATAGEDYQAVAGTLTFAPGSILATIRVPVIDDTIDEPDEKFLLLLDDAVGAGIDTRIASGTIRDDDEARVPPVLSVADAAATESDGELAFAVRLDRAGAGGRLRGTMRRWTAPRLPAPTTGRLRGRSSLRPARPRG